MSPVVSLVRSEAGLHDLEKPWSRLARDARDATPFQSPEWVLPWWHHFGTGRPLVAVCRAGEALLGLLACYELEEAGIRKMLPMGAGISDYLDALVAPGAPDATATALLETLLGGPAGVASCDLIDLRPGALLRQAAAPEGWRDETNQSTPCPVLTLPDPAVGLRRTIPSGTHRKLRMNRHRAERVGGWTRGVADEVGLSDAIEALARLHASRWNERGEPGGVFADARVLACIREAAPQLLRAGTIRLHVLCFGTETVAACMVFSAGQSVMLYLSGFDQAHAACSPGTLLLGEIVEEAIAEGRREVHFLRGGEAYKHAWGAADRWNATRRLTPR